MKISNGNFRTMKKYSVRVYLHTFCDYEVEAENEEEAQDIAESLEYDIDEILDNMCQCDDTDVEEIKPKKEFKKFKKFKFKKDED